MRYACSPIISNISSTPEYTESEEEFRFTPVTVESLPEINKYFRIQKYRTCDFTIGGLFMWASYFKYEYAIFNDTLFIKGVSEINASETAFSIPIGKLRFEESLPILKRYCERNNIKFILSAVPEEAANSLNSELLFTSVKLDNWADYLYEREALAALSGKIYNKKRNHVNKFHQTYPDYEYLRINGSNIDEVIVFFRYFNSQYEKTNPLFINEAVMTEYILENYSNFDFVGALIKINGNVAGFTIGEIQNDTAYIHIEKADRNYNGIYEAINMKFANDIGENFPDVKYINREEDVGDEGLRKAKLSYHPVILLNKYNLVLNDKSSTNT